MNGELANNILGDAHRKCRKQDETVLIQYGHTKLLVAGIQGRTVAGTQQVYTSQVGVGFPIPTLFFTVTLCFSVLNPV